MHPVPAALVPRFGSTWLHYKGGTYTVLAVAEHTETKELMVVYQHGDSLRVYTRPLAMWYDDMGEGRTRFTAVRTMIDTTHNTPFPRPEAMWGSGPITIMAQVLKVEALP